MAAASDNEPLVPEASPEAEALSEIMHTGYFAVSGDGLVRVVATGDQRLQSVEFATTEDVDIADLTNSVTEAVRLALVTAQRETVAAIGQVPGFGDLVPRESEVGPDV